MKENKILLQKLLIKENDFSNKMDDMLIRCDYKKIKSFKNYHEFKPGDYSFLTYFNSLSVKKWLKYSYADSFLLELDAAGDFLIEIYGHSIGRNDCVKSVKLMSSSFSLDSRETISIPLTDTNHELISFKIIVNKSTKLYSGGYYSKIPDDKIRKIDLALVTTTYNKEEYIFRNYDIINKNLFSDKEISDHLRWIIVDNGKSDKLKKLSSEKILVFANKNVGGAGGAARGFIEANRFKKKPTHLLIMDDDVKFIASSFKRLFVLLSVLKDEYRDSSFVAGAMLEMERPWIQHEDVGYISKEAVIGSQKVKWDMTDAKSIVLNERFINDNTHHYSAWWFCCIPMSIATPNNLPLPLFIRDDDIEYSIRNKAEIITMNGICIWHNRFEGRFSPTTDIYQSFKNELIISAIHDKIKDVAFFKKIYDIFWQELFKFNYSSAWLIAKSLEDYLKGPGYLAKTDGGTNIKKKKDKEPLFNPIPKKLKKRIDYDNLYTYEPLSFLKKFVYDYTCNGQKRFPSIKTGNIGIIPYGWGYNQKKIFLCDKVYAIDVLNNSYSVFSKDKKLFSVLSTKFNYLVDQYTKLNNKVIGKYKKSFAYLTSQEFWKKYLEIN